MGRARIFENIELPSFVWKFRSLDDVRNSTWFTKINWVNIALLVVFLVLAIRQARSKMAVAEKAGFEKRFLKAPTFPQPEEQPNFDYTKTEPLKLRPFKPKYHLTMALESLQPSDLILMDRNYADRIKYRTNIIKQHGTNVVNIHDDGRVGSAVKEYYVFMMGTYLPLRFPKMFKLHETDYETGKAFMLENKVTGSLHPAFPIPKFTKTITLLETLGRTIDEDILFLLPEETDDDNDDDEKATDPKYILHAYITCCPSGFNPSDKLGRKLAAIHEPVPGYKEKLEGSMDRFFAKLEVGKYVKRANWSITTDTELYAAGEGTNHAKEGEKVEELKEVDVDNTFLRCERQTLFRLPTSRAIVFSFKTYLTPIREIKEEEGSVGEEGGAGEELATAIEGLEKSSVQGMYFYKRGVVWGEAVKRFLRS